MVSFKDLQKNNKSNFEELANKTKKLNEKPSYDDDRFWTPKRGKDGNGLAIIRFLPGVDEAFTSYVRTYEHSFKGPSGLWYIEKSLTTIGKNDPVSELNNKLWNSTKDDKHPNRLRARTQARKTYYISNVYVVHDYVNEENSGKVKLYKYGKQIFDKLNEAMNPRFPDKTPFNPFDLESGANFRLEIFTKKTGDDSFPDYTNSSFNAQGPLFADEAKLEEIWKQGHDLTEFLNEKNFKSYDALRDRLDLVLGNKTRETEEVREEKEAARDTFTSDDPPFDLDDKKQDDEDDEFFKLMSGE